jgi:hypothetical protein
VAGEDGRVGRSVNGHVFAGEALHARGQRRRAAAGGRTRHDKMAGMTDGLRLTA